jgi:hypothetical protein
LLWLIDRIQDVEIVLVSLGAGFASVFAATRVISMLAEA